MAEFVKSLLGLIVRLSLVLAGLVFFASLMTLALVLLLVWLLRSFWAKLTGQTVTPWVFRYNRQPPWQRADQNFGKSPTQAQDDVIDADVCDVNVVTDVEPKRIDRPH
jgi:hypothetical protein